MSKLNGSSGIRRLNIVRSPSAPTRMTTTPLAADRGFEDHALRRQGVPHDAAGNVLTERAGEPDRDTAAREPDGDVRALPARRGTDGGRDVGAGTRLILGRDGHVEEGIADHEDVGRVLHRS